MTKDRIENDIGLRGGLEDAQNLSLHERPYDPIIDIPEGQTSKRH